jgi:hypothetical protein
MKSFRRYAEICKSFSCVLLLSFGSRDVHGQGALRSVDIVIVPSEELADPMHGYFRQDSYVFVTPVDIALSEENPQYAAWSPVTARCRPLFADAESPNHEFPDLAYFLNRHVDRLLKRKRENSFQRSGALYSPSSRRALLESTDFGMPGPNIGGFTYDRTYPKAEMLMFFDNNPKILENLTTIDLTYGSIEPTIYPFLAALPKLRRLALPRDGSDIGHPQFQANPNVRELVISNAILTELALSKIAEFKGIDRLVLHNCSIKFFVATAPFEKREGFPTAFIAIDPIESIRATVTDLIMIDCEPELINLVEAKQWSKLSSVTTDFVSKTMEDAVYLGANKFRLVLEAENSDDFLKRYLPLIQWRFKEIVPSISSAVRLTD